MVTMAPECLVIFAGTSSFLGGFLVSERDAGGIPKSRTRVKETDMMGWYGGGMGGGAWIFMGLFWVILIAAIIWLVVRLLPSSSHSGATTTAPHQVSGQESPLDILDRRFAAGELDLETYQAQRAALIAARGGR